MASPTRGASPGPSASRSTRRASGWASSTRTNDFAAARSSLSKTWKTSCSSSATLRPRRRSRTTFRRAGEEFEGLDYLVHSIAFAHREDLGGDFSKVSRKGFQDALEISAYSLIPLVRHAAGLMTEGGSVVAMTFNASERVYPGYNVMGVAKAALENEVRQLAAEYGPRNIRVNAISAGPLETLAARGIQGFPDMRRIHSQKAPLQRNITHREVGDTALYLCSPLSSGVTGAVIPVDAGYHVMAV